MSETSNGLSHPESNLNEISWKLGPRDFVLKNLKFIPWILIGGAVGLLLAYLKIRYTTPIYSVQSSMLINNQGGSSNKTDRFDALMMTPGSDNLSNETQILTSRPVLQRVVKNLGLTTRYYNIGKVRTSILYPESIFSMEILKENPHIRGFALQITILNDREFVIGKETKRHLFGEILEISGNSIILTR